MGLGSKFEIEGPREQILIRLFEVATPSLLRRYVLMRLMSETALAARCVKDNEEVYLSQF
jgi:hypothetical protein